MSGYALQCRQQDNANGFLQEEPTQFDQDQFGNDKALQRGDVYMVEAEEVWTDPFLESLQRGDVYTVGSWEA